MGNRPSQLEHFLLAALLYLVIALAIVVAAPRLIWRAVR